MLRRFVLAFAASAVLSFVAAAALGSAMEQPHLKTIATVVAYAHDRR